MSATPTPVEADPPSPPSGSLELHQPPALPSGEGSTGALLGVVPALGSLATMALLAGTGTIARPHMYAVVGLFGLVSLVLVLGQLDRQHTQRQRQVSGPRTAYLRYLAQVRDTLRSAHRAQRWDQERRHPPPSALPASAELDERGWDRTPEHDDFLLVRYGVGPQTSALVPVATQPDPRHQEDPVADLAARRLVATHESVPDLPAVVDLGSSRLLELRGPSTAARAVARAILCSATAGHSPDQLQVAVLRPEPGGDRGLGPASGSGSDVDPWGWLRWLPHALSTREADAAGPRRMVTADPDELTDLLPQDLTSRTAGDRLPHVLLVVDGCPSPPRSLVGGELRGVTVLVLGADAGTAGDVRLLRPGGAELAGKLDACDLPTAEALARRLTRRRGRAGSTRTPRPAGMIELPWAPDAWQPRADTERLRVSLGAAADGTPVQLDLKEAALGGAGPHGVVVGATGSGKSELLRTLVIGLAATHSPTELNLVLVDYKGGATFSGLAALPHVSALITNLEEESLLVERMHDALSGELVRRQQVLRAAGFGSAHDHTQARGRGADLEPLPSLLVVVDEFSELLAAHAEFADLFVTIGRLGRSLGLHLLLATQRLEEGRLRGLESHLSFRICLRTFSAAESRAVLGVADAHELPARPGVGLLRTDPATLARFTTTCVSAPLPPQAAPMSLPVLPWTIGQVSAAEPRVQAAPGESLLDVAVRAMRGHGPPARRVWLPPLETPATLDALLPVLETDPLRGLTVTHATGRLVVPVGTIDLPREQRHDVLTLDLEGAGGHVAVVGGPRSGKSTLLRTIVAGLALTATPREVQFLLLDLGGGLAALQDLPHVVALGDRLDPETVRRTVAELRGILQRREELFRTQGIDSMATYRTRRAAGDAGDGLGDVVLVVDGWAMLRAEYDDLEDDLQAISARALGFGVHLVVAATRWSDLRTSQRDVFGTRLELRLGDPLDSEVDRRAAALVPLDRPGRGLLPGARHFLAALPRIDGRTEPESLAAGTGDLVRRVADQWPGPPAPRVRLLPSRVSLDDVRRDHSPAPSFLLGLGERDLGPVPLDLTAHPHLLVVGEGRSGKSGCLRTLLHEIVRARSPAQAQVVLVDPRRTLTGVVPHDYLLHHLTTTALAVPALADLAAHLQHRLPGPEVGARQLRERSWWSGAEAFVVVDDHDLVSTAHGSPVQSLEPLLAQAHDVGLHLLLARRSGGIARAVYEPVLQTLRDLGTPTLLLAGSPEEGPVAGSLRLGPAPPGRARLVTRERGVEVVQVAWTEPSW